MRPIHIFLGTLCVGLVIQGWLWQHISFVDKDMWVEHMQHLVQMDPAMFSRSIYGHPGTPAMGMAIAVHWIFKIDWAPALLGSLALLNATSIAGVSALAYRLRPTSWWWLAAAGMLLANRLYVSSTPPTAVVAPLLTFITLLTWWLYKRGRTAPWSALIAWAGAMGVAGASRADISGLFALGLLSVLLPPLGWKKTVALTLLSLLVFWAVNPFMWWMPFQHVADLLRVMHFHYTEYEAYQIPLAGLLLISPLGLIGLGLAAAWSLLGRRLPQPIPPRLLSWLIALTVAICALLLQSHFQANRYFFPLAFLWETILPLFMLEAVAQLRFDWIRSPLLFQRARRLAAVFVLLLLLGGQWTMLLHIHWLPEVKIVCAGQQPAPLCQGNKAAILW